VIASGLGTPLTIDEATLNKRFGHFARILIDVDMAEKLFESIIVEREGYALTIMVQYEKHPSFCAHCKTIGHNVHSCSKMNVDVSAPTNANNVQRKVQTNTRLPYKKGDLLVNKVADPTSNDKAHHVAVGNKPAIEPPKDTYHSADDFEDGELSAHDVNEPDIPIVNQPNIALQNKTGENITLQNSFELLDNNSEQGELVIGEDTLGDKEPTPLILDVYKDKNPEVGESSLGRGNLPHSTCLEVSGNLVKRASPHFALHSSNPLLGPVNGKVSVPSTCLSTLLQSSPIGRLSYPNSTSASPSHAIFENNTTLQHVVTPITTTDEILGPDKRKVQFSAGPKNMSAACLKDAKALSKFLGAEPNTDVITTSDEVLNTDKGML
jgi:hypothetical protein